MPTIQTITPCLWFDDQAEEAARFYVGAATQPTLIVRDLKRGADAHGTVGLFVGNGTDSHFRNLSVVPR